ncbi:VanZ family protein [Tsuneonella sp. SYSU-LHT278]|uniref:VanZ family protein n=1 Tax=Tsuneonella sediminis TaxID=3416089 RepID=UPI003F798CF0
MTYSPRLARILREHGILEVTFIAGALSVFVFVIWDALNARWGKRDFAVALGIVAVYSIALSRIALPEERTHMIEYGVVGVLIYKALLERLKNEWPVWSPTLLAMLIVGTLGSIDEVLQFWHPTRTFDWRDIGFNWLAGILSITAYKAILRARAHI